MTKSVEWRCAFAVNLAAARDTTLRVRWYNPRTGQFHENSPIAGGNETQPFTSPFAGDAVLHLKEIRRR